MSKVLGLLVYLRLHEHLGRWHVTHRWPHSRPVLGGLLIHTLLPFREVLLHKLGVFSTQCFFLKLLEGYSIQVLFILLLLENRSHESHRELLALKEHIV